LWKSPSSKTLKQVGGIIALLIFAGLIYYGFRDIDRIKSIFESVRVSNLVLASIVYALGLLLSVAVLHRLYITFGVSIPFWRTYYIAFLSLLGRYIPGKFWILGFASYISKSIGKDPVKVLWASLVNQMISIFSIIPFAFFLYFETSNVWLLIGSVAVTIGAVAGSWWIYRKNRIPLIGFKFLVLTLIYFFSWLLTGLSFYLFIDGLGIDGNIVSLVSIFPVSYLVGLLSFFAPGGLGMREISLSYFLNAFVDMETAVAIGVMFRIFTTMVEFVLSIIAYFMYLLDREGT